jgi:hypothetical protein
MCNFKRRGLWVLHVDHQPLQDFLLEVSDQFGVFLDPACLASRRGRPAGAVTSAAGEHDSGQSLIRQALEIDARLPGWWHNGHYPAVL